MRNKILEVQYFFLKNKQINFFENKSNDQALDSAFFKIKLIFKIQIILNSALKFPSLVSLDSFVGTHS